MGEYFSHAAACIIGVQLNDRFLLRKGALKARRLADGEHFLLSLMDSFARKNRIWRAPTQ